MKKLLVLPLLLSANLLLANTSVASESLDSDAKMCISHIKFIKKEAHATGGKFHMLSDDTKHKLHKELAIAYKLAQEGDGQACLKTLKKVKHEFLKDIKDINEIQELKDL